MDGHKGKKRNTIVLRSTVSSIARQVIATFVPSRNAHCTPPSTHPQEDIKSARLGKHSIERSEAPESSKDAELAHWRLILKEPQALSRTQTKGKGKSQNAPHYGFTTLQDPGQAATIDIVCIHGLNGHAFETWTVENEEGNDICWPRDLLPEHFPRARILTYGYDGATEGACSLSHESIPDMSRTFLTKLALYRQYSPAEKRPIVFIAHSVGGIIVKHALVNSFMAGGAICHGHPLILNKAMIHQSTMGIIFLGTPHQGSDAAASWHAVLPLICSLSGQPSTRVMDDLLRDSDSLQDLLGKFASLVGNYWVQYVYETQPSRIRGGDWSLIVPRHSAVLHHSDDPKLGRATDHLGLARFSSAEDDCFMDIVRLLQTMEGAGLRNKIPSSSPVPIQTPQAGGAQPSANHQISNSQLYTQHLLLKQLGYPLWNATPSHDAPEEYRRTGIQIGDVGFLDEDGGFDFYFNICKPETHPIHLRRGVPLDYRPFRFRDDIRHQRDHHASPSQYLSSEEMWCAKCTQSDGNEIIHELAVDEGYHYRLTVEEGALLILPYGADREDVRALAKLEEYAKENAKSWFAYTDQRGMAVSELCLVTGCDKTSSWGMASFRPVVNSHSSIWFSSSAGPTGAINRWHSRLLPGTLKVSREHVEKNQCVFLRGFHLSRRPFKAPLEKVNIPVGLLKGTAREGYYKHLALDPSFSATNSATESQSMPTSTTSSKTDSGQMTATSAKTPDMFHDHIKVESLTPPIQIVHPGHILNRHIMELASPEVEIAITHDDDWCNLEPAALATLLSGMDRDVASTLTSLADYNGDIDVGKGMAGFRRDKQVHVTTNLPSSTTVVQRISSEQSFYSATSALTSTDLIMERHEKYVHQRDPHICKTCLQIFNHAPNLWRHRSEADCEPAAIGMGDEVTPRISPIVYHFVRSGQTGARERFCQGVFPDLTTPPDPGVMSEFPLSDLFLRTVGPPSTAADESLIDQLALPVWATLFRIAHKYQPGDRAISNTILDAGFRFGPVSIADVSEEGAFTLTAALRHSHIRSLALTYLGAQELDHAHLETALSAFHDRLNRLLQTTNSSKSQDEVYLLWKMLASRLSHWKEVDNRDRTQRYTSLVRSIMECFLTSEYATEGCWETILHVTEALSLHTEKTLRAIASPTILRQLLQQYHSRGNASCIGEGTAHMAIALDRKHIGRIVDFCVSGRSPELREAMYTTLMEVNMFPEDVPPGSSLDLFWSSSTCGIILEGIRKVETREAWMIDWFAYMHAPHRLFRLCKSCMEHQSWSKQLEYISSIAPESVAWILCWKELLQLLCDDEYLCSMVNEDETVLLSQYRLFQGLVQLRAHLIVRNPALQMQLDIVPQSEHIADSEPDNLNLTTPDPAVGSVGDTMAKDPHPGQPNVRSAPSSLRSPSLSSLSRAANGALATVLKAKVVFNGVRRRNARGNRSPANVDLERGPKNDTE